MTLIFCEQGDTNFLMHYWQSVEMPENAFLVMVCGFSKILMLCTMHIQFVENI